jgi:hypothetical protein
VTAAKSLEQALAEAFVTADSLDAPLEDRLKLYLGQSRRLLPDLEGTYDQLVQRIAANGADAFVPAVGEVLPNFLMTDAKGHLVDLTSLLAKGPLVISFDRGPVRLLRARAACARARLPCDRRRRRGGDLDRPGDGEICEDVAGGARPSLQPSGC